MRTTHAPASRDEWLRLRRKVVSSTESAALFGLSPYCTAYELAMLKAGKIEDTFAGNERTEWGTDLEDAIAQGVARRYGVTIRRKSEYIALNDVRMGASFDYEVTGIADGQAVDECLRVNFGQHGRGILEIKNVDSLIHRNQWKTGEDQEAPAHIEIQLQHQMHVDGAAWGCIAALVGGNRVQLILRARDVTVGAAIRAKIAEFWTNLDRGVYPPVTLPEDADIVRRVFNYAEPGQLLDARGNAEITKLCDEYVQEGKKIKAAEDIRKSVQAQLLQILGENESCIFDGGRIAASMVAPTVIPEHTRSGYRGFRIYQKK